MQEKPVQCQRERTTERENEREREGGEKERKERGGRERREREKQADRAYIGVYERQVAPGRSDPKLQVG